MKNSKFRGIGDVFKFTYIQSMKSKATSVTLIIFCLLGLLTFPIVSLISGDSTTSSTNINTLYVYQDGVDMIDALDKCMANDEIYANVNIVNINSLEKFEKNKDTYLAESDSLLLEIVADTDITSLYYGIGFKVYYSTNDAANSDETDNLVSFLSKNGSTIKYMSVGIDTEVAAILSEDVSYNVYAYDENGKVVSDGITDAQYAITYGYLMFMMICISFMGSKVAGQIVTEKSSKVVEYILVSVKPMALIIGKILATLVVVGSMLGLVVVCFILSGFINGAMVSGADGSFVLPEVIANFFDKDVMVGANITTVIVSIILFVEGFTLYGLLAGIGGAMVSKVEEMAEGTKLFTFATLIGVYLTMALIISSNAGGEGWGDLNYLVYFFPLSAVFIVPSYMLYGIITPGVGIAIVLVDLVCIIGLAYFVSTIYEQLIYHSGRALKIKDLFKLSKKRGNK